jgi:hypothetical protein
MRQPVKLRANMICGGILVEYLTIPNRGLIQDTDMFPVRKCSILCNKPGNQGMARRLTRGRDRIEARVNLG